MKKSKMLLISAGVAFALTACGGGNADSATPAKTVEVSTAETPAPTTEAPTEAPTAAAPDPTTAAATEESDDGIINCQNSDGSILKYTKHEVVRDYQDKPVLGLYFDYTNNTDEASMVLTDFGVKIFQNGVECSIAVVMDGSDEFTNSTKEIKPGVTLPVCLYFSLSDTTSDVEVEAGDWINLSGKVDTQVIQLSEGGSSKGDANSAEKAEAAPTEAASVAEGVINYKDSDGSSLVYTKHEVVKDYEGNPALAVFFDYTNNSDDGAAAMFSFSVNAYQNGVSCDVAILLSAPDEYQNSTKEIKSGVTLPVCWVFGLDDASADVEMEVGPLIDFSGKEKAKQILSLQ